MPIIVFISSAVWLEIELKFPVKAPAEMSRGVLAEGESTRNNESRAP
ncbi:hypothetical protein [Subtercola boreus]|nr:hypothetical protein [Subtercola boreus]